MAELGKVYNNKLQLEMKGVFDAKSKSEIQSELSKKMGRQATSIQKFKVSLNERTSWDVKTPEKVKK